MSIFRMAKRLSGRWLDSQGYCGVRDFDEPQVAAVLEVNGGTAARLGIQPGDRVLHRAFGSGS